MNPHILARIAIAFELFAPWPFVKSAAQATPPTITTQPRDAFVCDGAGEYSGQAQFYCVSSGTQPLHYQWRRGAINLTDGGNVAGANSSLLYIWPAKLTDAAQDYNCLVTNADGSAVSNNVILAVFPTATADVNGDGAVDGLDVQAFVGAWLAPPPRGAMTMAYCAADMDRNGYLGCDDLCVFVQALLQSPLGCGAPPANDDCVNASPISTGVVYNGSTAYGTRDGPHLPCEQYCDPVCNTAPDVWFKWVADFSGPATISTCDATRYDDVLAIFDGCPSMGGLLLACNDDGFGCSPQFLSRICAFPVSSGQTYWICVSGWGGEKGCYSLRVSPGDCL